MDARANVSPRLHSASESHLHRNPDAVSLGSLARMRAVPGNPHVLCMIKNLGSMSWVWQRSFEETVVP